MSEKNNSFKQKPSKNYLELLYMTPAKLRAKDIFALLKDTPGIMVELWEEMNILELELSNHDTIDFEPIELFYKNSSDAAFVKHHDINTIFGINLCEADLNTAISIFKSIIAAHSGFLCADSDDFMPIYAGSL